MKLSKIFTAAWLIIAGYLFIQFVIVKREASQFVANFKTYDNESAIDIYDRNDKLMFQFNKKNRIPVSINKITPHVIYPVVGVEDRFFYDHSGVSYIGLARATKDYLLGRGLSGGSTITMQLVRMLTNNRERTLGRKFKEIIFARELEKKYSKDEILERYLNETYFGKNIYGIEAASKFYFGKGNMELTLDEALFLIGIINAPERYLSDGTLAKRRFLRRKEHILKRIELFSESFYLYLRMQDGDMLTAPDIQQNYLRTQSPNSYAVEEVRKYLYSKYTTTELRKGMKVYTTFDSNLQNWGQEVIQNQLNDYEPQVQGSLLAINQLTGEVYAVVGGRNFSTSEFNRAFQAKRQPGSAFKPFVYGAAFESGDTPLTILQDSPLKIRMNQNSFYTPMNNDREFWGPVTAWEALVYSRNVPSVRLNMKITPSRTIDYAKKCGIESEIPNYPSSALGTGTVTLKEMTRAYGTIANLGTKTPTLFFINRVENRFGRVLEEHKREETVQILNPDKTYELSETLRGVVEEGTGKTSRIEIPTAGKTGTSDDRTDAWFIGYSSNITCGVWIGRDDNKKISKIAEGGTLAAPLWAKFMKKTINKNIKEDLPVPVGSQRKNFAPPEDLGNVIYHSRRQIRERLKNAPPEVIIWK